MVGVRAGKVAVAVMLSVGVAGGARAQAQCGSAVLGEKARPAVFQGITLGPQTVVRLWALGQASTNVLAGACGVGCRSFSASSLCDGGGDCTAVTGVEWLNGSCGAAGFLPQTSVLLLEAPTSGDGGRWAVLKVPHNPGDANFDLDAAAAAICGPSCATLARSYAGGGAQGIEVLSAVETGGVVELELRWLAPAPSGQALNAGGGDLITSYSVWVARSSAGIPPDLSGAKTGWTRIDDTDDGALAGYSTDTRATVSVALGGSNEAVYVALGVNFDGTGNPGTDPNTVESNYISRGIEVWNPAGPGPLVTAVLPSEGPVTGGTRLVVSGTGLDGTAGVTVGGNPATEVSVVGANRLTAVSPTGSVGPADVVVSTGAGTSVMPGAFRYEELEGAGLAVDGVPSGGSSNVNGVLEPGERVVLSPSWTNLGGSTVELSGHAGGLVGAGGTVQWMWDTVAVYGSVDGGATGGCSDGPADCYELELEAPANRPGQHWDLRYEEVLSTGGRKVWTVHVGQSFDDVAMTQWAYRFVETLLHNGITAGCGGGNYCPGSDVNRLAMAVFLSASMVGGDQVPASGTVEGMGDYDCRAGGVSLFGDIGAGSGGCRFVHYLAREGITNGCGGGNYCPWDAVTRWQMAVFLAVAMAGSGDDVPVSGTVPGMGTYNCVTGGSSVFSDVPPDDGGCKYIHYIAAEGITSGCGGGNYCPWDQVTRAQMAVFLTAAFDLKLNGG